MSGAQYLDYKKKKGFSQIPIKAMCSLQLRTVFLMTMTEISAMKLMIRILNFPAKDKWNSSTALNRH